MIICADGYVRASCISLDSLSGACIVHNANISTAAHWRIGRNCQLALLFASTAQCLIVIDVTVTVLLNVTKSPGKVSIVNSACIKAETEGW
jgi:hypothetical protein